MSATVASALQHARQRGVDRLDAQLLLAHVLLAHGLQRNRAWLIAHDEVELPAALIDAYEHLLARRAAGEPLAYLIGQKEFYGLTLQVDTRVLVPRPETELLVDWALELLRARSGAGKTVDLGTGSGAIALALKHAHPGATVWATDASEAALTVARDNASRLGLVINFTQGSWWQAVPKRQFDLAVSNPPYIADGDHHLPALRHEPMGALSPGPSGLEALETIVAQAPEHLRPGGWLLLEHGFDQAVAVRALLADHGFSAIQTRADLAGQPRCTGARR